MQILLLNSGSAACYLKSSSWEARGGRKRKVPLFRRLATWGESCPKTNSEGSAQSWKFLKGESFEVCVRIFLIYHCVQTLFWLVDGEVIRAVFQESCVQPEVTILYDLEPKGIVMYIPWRATRTLLYCALLFLDCSSFFFYTSSLPWSAPVWISPLELRKAMEAEWSLFSTNKKRDTERICNWEGPTVSTPQVKDSFPQDCFLFRYQSQVWASSTSDWPAISQGFPWHPPWVW